MIRTVSIALLALLVLALFVPCFVPTLVPEAQAVGMHWSICCAEGWLGCCIMYTFIAYLEYTGDYPE